MAYISLQVSARF